LYASRSQDGAVKWTFQDHHRRHRHPVNRDRLVPDINDILIRRSLSYSTASTAARRLSGRR